MSVAASDTARVPGVAGKTAIVTALALIGFAANSVLCRKALGSHAIDAWSFTCIRLASGALVLFAIARARASRASDPSTSGGEARARRQGSWISAFALFAYAAAFSLAYSRLSTGVGALVLFACVQATMIGWGIKSGERPTLVEWLGIAIALGGLAWLKLFGARASGASDTPDTVGLLLMMSAGIAWGTYSLRGRASRAPLSATADNFARSVPMAIAGALAGAMLDALKSRSDALASSSWHLSTLGVLLAVASGSIASGIGYSLWYAALPSLRATHAAVLQLLVPILAASFGILLLGEQLSVRLVGSGAMILGGVALAVLLKRRPASTRTAPAPNRIDASARAGTPRAPAK
jgi:drug/metabolite transporter (DMT)-like permease